MQILRLTTPDLGGQLRSFSKLLRLLIPLFHLSLFWFWMLHHWLTSDNCLCVLLGIPWHVVILVYWLTSDNRLCMLLGIPWHVSYFLSSFGTFVFSLSWVIIHYVKGLLYFQSIWHIIQSPMSLSSPVSIVGGIGS
jgi:hypothetical protein